MARIVFDLDGTLIDSAPDIGGIANGLLADRGLPPITSEQTRDFVGKGPGVFIEKMRTARNIPQSEQTTLLTAFMANYDGAVGLTHPYPGVVNALENLRTKGHRLGICTNKPIKPTMAVLRHLDLEQYFETFVGGDSLAVHKPDPAPLEQAFAALGDGKQIFVGDSEVDAATALAAGVTFLLFTEGYRKKPIAELPHDQAFSHFDGFCDLVGGIT
ncbi:MAG: phosphoglycolate phosphatase [Silicimonas sp.]|nr:phosphoglycolate phosphatase [Silicimonas sp.]